MCLGCLVLRKCRKLAAVASLSNNENVLSTNLNQIEGRESALLNHLCSKSQMKMLANTGPTCAKEQKYYYKNNIYTG